MYKTTGFISFLFRRVSGVALVLYLFTHIWVIGAANGRRPLLMRGWQSCNPQFFV